MSIFYKLRKHKKGMSNDSDKYYAHTVKQGELSMQDIERIIQDNCTAKRSDVRVVLTELVEVMKQRLQQGYVVNLGEIGKFQLVVRSSCADSKEDFTYENIKGLACKFTPQGKRAAKRKLERSFFEGCKILRWSE